MKKKFRIVSLLLTAVLLMSVYVTPAVASQGENRGQERGQEKQDADQIQYLDAEVQVIDGRPVLKVETEEGHTGIPFEFPAYAISADGQEVAVKREGDAILLPTENGLEAVPLKDFCVVMVNGQIMLLAEVNPLWKFPIAKAAVIAALNKAGVKVTRVSIYVGARLMLAGARVTKTSVAVGIVLKNAGIPIIKTTVNAGKILREAGAAITRTNVAMHIIREALKRAGIAVTAHVVLGALNDWRAGRCIVPLCVRPAERYESFIPSRMMCAPCSP